jgi:hypothetical protein
MKEMTAQADQSRDVRVSGLARPESSDRGPQVLLRDGWIHYHATLQQTFIFVTCDNLSRYAVRDYRRPPNRGRHKTGRTEAARKIHHLWIQ